MEQKQPTDLPHMQFLGDRVSLKNIMKCQSEVCSRKVELVEIISPLPLVEKLTWYDKSILKEL